MIKMACKWLDICPLRKFEEQGKISEEWKKNYCSTNENWNNCKRYQFEAEGKYHPDNMLPNGEIDEKLR